MPELPLRKLKVSLGINDNNEKILQKYRGYHYGIEWGQNRPCGAPSFLRNKLCFFLLCFSFFFFKKQYLEQCLDIYIFSWVATHTCPLSPTSSYMPSKESSCFLRDFPSASSILFSWASIEVYPCLSYHSLLLHNRHC